MKPIIERELRDGVQKIYRFNNEYGASVVKHNFSYGGDRDLWELAVIIFTAKDDIDYTLDYSTTITNDVIGYLKWEDVEEILKKIEAL